VFDQGRIAANIEALRAAAAAGHGALA
jgi:hypothetical protein